MTSKLQLEKRLKKKYMDLKVSVKLTDPPRYEIKFNHYLDTCWKKKITKNKKWTLDQGVYIYGNRSCSSRGLRTDRSMKKIQY